MVLAVRKKSSLFRRPLLATGERVRQFTGDHQGQRIEFLPIGRSSRVSSAVNNAGAASLWIAIDIYYGLLFSLASSLMVLL